jgi:hypothetical protein
MPRQSPRLFFCSSVAAAALLAACSASAPAGGGAPAVPPPPAHPIRVVFVVAMENQDARDIYGNVAEAPYINGTLLRQYAHATNFVDELAPEIPSEPHYVWMEAGTNAFPDHVFVDDRDAIAANSTGHTAHLATQIQAAGNGLSWRAYQEGINDATGRCPIASSGFYAPKHDPFVFFRDVSGSPPSKTNEYCASHHKDTSALAADLATGSVASYNFITPDLCHDMHGAQGCASMRWIQAGDQWLQANLPALISYVNAHDGVIYLTWDEPEETTLAPFIAIGPHVKAGYAGGVRYTHSALLKSVEESLGLPVLPTVQGSPDLADLFEAGYFP